MTLMRKRRGESVGVLQIKSNGSSQNDLAFNFFDKENISFNGF